MATKFKDSGKIRDVVRYSNASKDMKRVCLICGLPFGEHFGQDCPTNKEQNKLKELYGTN